MLSFEYIQLLWGLLLAIPLSLVFWWVIMWKKKVKNHLGDDELVQRLTGSFSPSNYLTKFGLLLAAVVLCIIAAANLRSASTENEGKRSGVDVMIALDVSNSMLAQDVQPNRLERAKQLLHQTIEGLSNNRLGLVVFAGQAILQMPLTPDASAARMYISNAAPDAVPNQGTVVADALQLCNNSLNNREKKYKSIILISDGESHDENTPEAVKKLADDGVIIHTVGIGSPAGAPIYDPLTNDFKKDENGNVVVSKLNEDELKMIAAQTGGTYTLFASASQVSNILVSNISQMDTKQIAGGGLRQYNTYFQVFVLLAICCLVLETLIPERKMKWLK